MSKALVDMLLNETYNIYFYTVSKVSSQVTYWKEGYVYRLRYWKELVDSSKKTEIFSPNIWKVQLKFIVE